MTGASDTLDPIAAAEAGIAGSKHLIAAVADDLSQQERWLAHYRVAERRRARRARIRELIYWLELRRQRLARWLWRMALTGLRQARMAAAFLWRNAVALFDFVWRTATACVLWLRPRAYALVLTLAAWSLALSTWTLVQARLLARATAQTTMSAAAWVAREARILGAILRRWLIAGWAWSKIEAARLARAAVMGASTAAGWSAARSRAAGVVLRRDTLRLAASLRRETSRLTSWTRKKTGHFSRASLATASLGFSWAKSSTHQADPRRRALAIRRCTALVSFEPRRAQLPALSAPAAPRPVSSHAVHASP